MSWSFPIGRLLGSELRVHATFFLLIAWIGAIAFAEGGWPAAITNIAFVCALFACVVAHEFGHALMARRYGIATPDITLLPIGGLARLERMPEKPAQEIAVALAGPAVNVVIWAVLVVFLGAGAPMETLAEIDDPAAGFWARLAALNLFLALFNLLPAFPMDGGRVFRALLSVPMGRVRATRTAALGGQIMAFGFGFLGLTTGNLLLLLIAVFIFLAAGAESSDVALRETARGLPAQAAMITVYEPLAPEDTLSTAANSLLRSTQHEFPVLGPDGALQGVLTRNAIFAAVAGDQPRRTPVVDLMDRDIPAVSLGSPLTEALQALYQGRRPAVAVTDREGRFLGYITRENVGELMVVSGRG